MKIGAVNSFLSAQLVSHQPVSAIGRGRSEDVHTPDLQPTTRRPSLYRPDSISKTPLPHFINGSHRPSVQTRPLHNPVLAEYVAKERKATHYRLLAV